VNWIDTAPIYGRGHSEELLGTILSNVSEPPYVFTKGGVGWDQDGNEWVDARPSTIRREVEASLRRLRRETIDLYMIHWPPVGTSDKGDLNSAWETLIALKDEEKLRHIGLSNCEVHQLQVVHGTEPIACLQYPYSLVNRNLEGELLEYCATEGIGVIVWGAMYHGILTGGWSPERLAGLAEDDWRRHDDKFKEPILDRALAIGNGVQKVAAEIGISAGQLAVAWALRDERITGAIIGLRSASQVAELVETRPSPLTQDVEARLNSLAPKVPVQVRTF
jgi:aryl-alcohol dehydrogenase-like predicted oxidoreductase